MRRAYLLASIAAGAVALFTTVQVTAAVRQDRKIETFKHRLADLTFCRTGFEIASSRPHYMARFAKNPEVKAELIHESDVLEAKKDQMDQLISDHIKEGDDLDLDTTELTLFIEMIQREAEQKAVHVAGWVEKPEVFLDHITEVSDNYLN